VRRGALGAVQLATRAGWAWVWAPTHDRLLKIVPEGGGPVNSVALSRDGKDLLIGTGYYPLSGADSVASLERWTLDPEPSFQAGPRLLGAAVDCMDWNPHTGTIAALLGATSQDRGYLVLLDETDLQIGEVFEIEFAHSSSIRLSPGAEWIAFVHRKGVERRDLSDFSFRERVLEVSADTSGAHISDTASHVLLSNGHLYSMASNERIDLPELPGVAAVAFGPRDLIYGLTGKGLLRAWQTSTR
jgi:hypothetical protein